MKDFQKSLISIALPVTLQSLLQSSFSVIDQVMIGQMGSESIAGIGLGGKFASVYSVVLGAVAAVAGIMIAQYIGQKNEKNINKGFYVNLMFAAIIATVFMAVCLIFTPAIMSVYTKDTATSILAEKYLRIYSLSFIPMAVSTMAAVLLRCLEAAVFPLVASFVSVLVNTALNYLLIFGKFGFPKLGVEGAAIASAISFVIGGIIITIAVWRHPEISPKGQSFKPDMEVLKPCLKVAIPNMLQRFGTSLGYVAFASMINSVGEIATAAHTIANTVESAFYVPAYGMQTAAATLAGNAYGAGDKKRMQNITTLLIVIEVSLMIITGGLLFIFAPNMMMLFSNNDEVISVGSTVLRMVALSEPIYGVSIIIEGMMHGVGNTVTPFAFNLIGMWGIRIVGTFILTQLFSYGLVAAWGCMILHNVCVFIMFTISYSRGKWNPLYKNS